MISESIDRFALLEIRITLKVKFFGAIRQFFDCPCFVRRRLAPDAPTLRPPFARITFFVVLVEVLIFELGL
ncbi:MAG: hypothetical protein K0Q61_3267 [Rhodococcus erythropolis]|nr:hypothetical protein [Rhodococcus erythropolis]